VGWRKLASSQTQVLADLLARLQQGPLHGSEDPKVRRRRLYRLASEERPAFPTQQRNFYSHVMENKEVVKMLSLLSTCTEDIKPVSSYMSQDNLLLCSIRITNSSSMFLSSLVLISSKPLKGFIVLPPSHDVHKSQYKWNMLFAYIS
jgi:hypothetical protein